MAYGNVLGYTPGPQPGTYSFQQADGRNVLLAGPPAESLKARLDASAGLAGQRVAGPGGGAPNDAAPVPSIMAGSGALNDAPAAAPAPAMSIAPPSAPSPAMSVAPTAPPEPPAMSQIGPTNESAASAPPPPAPAPVHVGPQPIIDPGTGINTGRVRLPDGRIAVPVAGTPAVTKEQLEAKAGQGVMVAHSGSESVTGGFAPDQDYLDRRHDLAIDKRLTIDKTADIEAENAVREKNLADQQFQDAAALKAEETARVAQVQAQVQKDLETKDRLQREYANAKVDPRRIFSGQGGTARSVLAAIAAGLGAAGSGLQAMGGHPGATNLGYQAVQTAIDRDVAAQEGEIKIKGEAAQNALSQYLRSGLSLGQAKTALRSAHLGWAAAQVAQNAAITKGSMVDVNRDAMHNQLLSALNDADEQYRVQSLGTATKTVAGQMQYAHGGSGGGYRVATPEEADKEIDRTIKREGDVAGTAKTIGEIGKTGAAKSQGQANVDGAIATTETSLKRLANYKPDEVAPLPENRGAIPRAWNATKDFFGGAGTSARGMSAHDSALIQDTEEARSEVRALNSVLGGQGALSDPERVQADKGMAPGATVGEIMRSLAMLRERANAIKAKTEAK